MKTFTIQSDSEDSKNMSFLYAAYGILTSLNGLRYFFMQNPDTAEYILGTLFLALGLLFFSLVACFNRRTQIDIDAENIRVTMLFAGQINMPWSDVRQVSSNPLWTTIEKHNGARRYIFSILLGLRLNRKLRESVADYAFQNELVVG